MGYIFVVLCLLMGSVTPVMSQVSIGIGLPSVSISINLPLYPELERVPGYPVYYATRIDSNYFFYDGMYWVYQGDNWYASSWYNGPWGLVGPEVVPLFVLRIPVRYYRAPPAYFRGWQADAPPRWGDHWGNQWQQRRGGWDRWDRNVVPAPAPLPTYQRQYSGDRYPQLDQQRTLHTQNYRYQPRDSVVRQHYQERIVQKPAASPQPEQRGAPQDRRPQDTHRPASPQQSAPQPQSAPAAPRAQAPQKGGDDVQRTPAQASPQRPAGQEQRQQQPQQRATPAEPQEPRSRQDNTPQGKGAAQEERRGQGQEKGRDRDEERGQDRKK